MKVIAKEDIRVATLSGGIFVLTANEPAECADEIGLIAMQMGAKMLSIAIGLFGVNEGDAGIAVTIG